MKKIILAIIVTVIVFAFTFPIYADQPAEPGANGKNLSGIAGTYPGALADAIADFLDNYTPEPFKNLGQRMSDKSYDYGIPPKHIH